MTPTLVATRMLSSLKFKHIVILAFAMRVALIVYAEFHDAHSVLKYTDIDYRVFSDAARFILNPTNHNHARGSLGSDLPLGDPYTRSTYRYTPLLALLLTPNEWLHPTFGKLLFATADIFIGILVKRMLSSSSRIIEPTSSAKSEEPLGLTRDEIILMAIWLINPLPANISTRGSAESLLGLMVMAMLYAALQKRWDMCAVLLGLSVHWKIYPIIYVGSLIVCVGSKVEKLKRKDQSLYSAMRNWIYYALRWLVDRQRIRFGLISASIFFFLSSEMYRFWGHPFIEHSYLYHIGRTDHRHNFSIYFYPLYLGLTKRGDTGLQPSESRQLGLVAFIPQMLLSIGGGLFLAASLRESRETTQESRSTNIEGENRSTSPPKPAEFIEAEIKHLPFIFLAQTLVFVTLNKVCTSQYFMWYLWFLPLAVPGLVPSGNTSPKWDQSTGISARKALLMVVLWVGAQALWLSQGYRLEFLGESVFVELWACGVLWLIVNAWLVGELVKGYRWD